MALLYTHFCRDKKFKNIIIGTSGTCTRIRYKSYKICDKVYNYYYYYDQEEYSCYDWMYFIYMSENWRIGCLESVDI